MWGTHFSPLFERLARGPGRPRLRAPALPHRRVALLVAGRRPGSRSLADAAPGRAMYLFLQMPQNTFLALAIYSASQPLYAHYANLGLSWGPSALVDQHLAGGLMWIIGDLVFVTGIVLCVAGWMRFEERDTARREVRPTPRWP